MMMSRLRVAALFIAYVLHWQVSLAKSQLPVVNSAGRFREAISFSQLDAVDVSTQKLEGAAPHSPQMPILMETDTVQINSQIDDMEKQNKKAYEALKHNETKERDAKKAAKDKYHASRKDIRHNYVECKKEVRKDGHKIDSSFCKALGLPLTTPADASSEKKDHVYCSSSRCHKAQVRMAEKAMKHKAKHDYKKAKDAYKDYKKNTKAAKSKWKHTKRIAYLIRPIVEKALAKIKPSPSADQTVANATVAVQETPDLAEVALKDLTIAKTFVSAKLTDAVGPFYGNVFTTVIKDVWAIVSPAVQALSAAMISAVGSVPVVGGVLSAAISNVFQSIMQIFTTAVNKELTKLGTWFTSKTVDTVVNLLFPAGVFTKLKADVIRTKVKDLENTNTEAYNAAMAAKAKASETDAAGQQDVIVSEAHADSKDVNATIVEDAATEKTEDDADDTAEEQFD